MIWILWHKRVGDLNQMVELAKVLDLPFEIKKLQFSTPHYGPISSWMLKNPEVLAGPLPKLVICAEGLCSNIAHLVKGMSGGAVKTVAMARPCGDPNKFDLVLTTAQYSLVGKNIVTLDLPLTAVHTPAFKRKGGRVVLVGGNAPPDVLNEVSALKMASDLLRLDQAVTVVTSPRTPKRVSEILSQQFTGTHVWQQGKLNPYAEILAGSSEIIVTSDSVSMLADALGQQVPVYVYKLPQRLSIFQKLVLKFYHFWPRNFIFKLGLIEITPDRIALVERLVKRGFVSWFGSSHSPTAKFNSATDLETAKVAVKLLL